MIKLNFTTPFLKPRDIKGMTSAPCRQRQAELTGQLHSLHQVSIAAMQPQVSASALLWQWS